MFVEVGKRAEHIGKEQVGGKRVGKSIDIEEALGFEAWVVA